jgi:tetratricopeptide (TPR) repeat protein
LNRIRVEEDQSGNKMSRIEHLRRLLKDDKNKEFIDQIYYQVGEQYFAQNNLDDAIKNYKLSIRSSAKNANQKGMSYLRIADIDFKNKADYASAKRYYDSTLVNLSPNYPGYQTIRKKSDNLQLLVDRLQIISREDTLQMLALLNEKDRAAKITQIVNRTLLQQQNAIAAANTAGNNQPIVQSGGVSSTSSFYFYNTTAMSQGYADFKRIWGNRPLSDNWRRSSQATDNGTTVNPAVTNVVQQVNQTAAPNPSLLPTPTNPAAAKMQQDLIGNLPLTAAQLTQSNNKVYNAYLDIANFYKDILDDPKEATTIFELLLKRFPNSINKPTLYYNLYRLYSDTDPKRSDSYKDLILKNYPESDFAKVILDPNYNQKLNDKNAEFTAFYARLFDLVAHRKYAEAATRSDELIAQFPGNNFLAQVYYLRLIALGHQQKLDPFKLELQEILDKFPDDRLIVPLVKQHLSFIAANEVEVAGRDVVLTDTDPTEVPFMQKQPVDNNPYVAANPVKQQPLPTPAKQTASAIAPVVAPPVGLRPVANVVEAPSIFSLRDSSNYYFVVNVNTNRINLAPSRFGIGQFNRANYKDNTIKHQLKPVAENQLIYVGRFGNLAAAKAYARAIVPLLPEIMNIAADKYTFFIITQENLDRLADKKTLDSYFDYYQKHY